jgi:DHA2 family multidrug resistance protein
MFLVNLVPGIFVSITVFLYAHFDKPNYKLLNNFDFLGIALLAISLGTLEYVLEEGSKKDWFDDTHILFLSITVFLSFIGLLIRELTCKNPIVALDAFYNRNFTCGCIYSFVLGIGLFGVIYLLPMYLFIIAGYSTVQIGITMIATGAAQFVTAPIAATLLRAGMDKRMILFIGFGAFSLGCYLNSFLTIDSRYWEVFIPQLIRGFALMFCFIPINDLALGTLPKDKVQNGSGLYSLIRNLGGAIGLAVINTTIISHSKIHGQAIRDDISMTAPQIQAALENLTQTLVGKVIDPELAAYRIIEDILLRESFVIAINDVFASIGLLFAFAILLIPLSNNTNNKADVH